MNRLKVDLLGTRFKNPILMASGTYGFGEDFTRFYDPSILGGFCTKGLTLEARDGNRGIRLWETPSGLINSIGLENPGVENFVEEIFPRIRNIETNILPNLGGKDEESYLKAVECINAIDVPMIELNISCPNVKHGGMAYGMDPKKAAELTRKVKEISNHPVIVKLSPNAPSVVDVALAVEEAGADALSLINTIQAMAVDVKKKKIVFDAIYAGFSGPAVFPIALRMVHQVASQVNIPVIGLGGVQSAEDVLSMIMAGASLVQIGTAGFAHPNVIPEIIEELDAYCEAEDTTIEALTGILLS